jgi:hypothetical protein
MKRRLDVIPPERSRQFDVIEAASTKTLRWAAHEAVGNVAQVIPAQPELALEEEQLPESRPGEA